MSKKRGERNHNMLMIDRVEKSSWSWYTVLYKEHKIRDTIISWLVTKALA